MTDTAAQADLDAIRAILQRQPGDDLVCAVAALQVRCVELEAWWAQWARVSMAALGMNGITELNTESLAAITRAYLRGDISQADCRAYERMHERKASTK